MYDRKEQYENALKLIKDRKLIRASEIISLSPYTERTFYEWFPPGSQELQCIKKELENNRTDIKLTLREKFENGSSAEKIVLYKLCANEDERMIINNTERNTGNEESLKDIAEALKGNYTTK